MSSHGSKRFPIHHGYGEVKVSRYFVLYLTQIGWAALGAYLLWNAYWPSGCIPHNLFQVYSCSVYLPDATGWRQAALMTWLWVTPLLILLEISRHVHIGED